MCDIMHCHLSSTKVEILSIFHTRPIECYSFGLLEVYIVDVNDGLLQQMTLMGAVSYNKYLRQKKVCQAETNVNQVGSPIVKLKIMSDI